MKNIQRSLVLGASIVALAGCGADEIVSPGTSGDIIINNPAPAPTPTPSPTPTQSPVTPAAGCPTILTTGGLTDTGTISGPTGEYRVCRLPAVFTADDTLPAIDGLVYEIFDEVSVGVDEGFDGGAGDIGEGVSLTIEEGAILYGTAASFLVVPRGNQIFSDGTETNPIIWTSRDNILGLNDDNSQAQWGGVVLLGRGRVSDCFDQVFNTTTAFTNDCQMELEGNANTILFGGEFDDDSSGSFTYNQIRYSGFELLQGSELQSLTTGGVGSGTTISHIFSFNSSDDGLEFFGGAFNANNIAVIGASDDSLDVDSGARVNVETVVVAQRSGTGDSIIELDSPGNEVPTPGNALPQSNFQVNNATFLQRSSASSQAVRGRGGAFLSLTNTVIDVDSAGDVCLRLDEDDNVTNTTVDSTVCDGDTRPFRGPANDADVEALVTSGTNNDFRFTLSLTGVVNGANENGVTPFDATARSSFFSNSTFVGAVESDLTTDFGDWTCNSSILDFGSANGACTSLPVN
ncbi:MAG: hypothetical protein AAF697_11570 [Pseudomonadota bacterium]